MTAAEKLLHPYDELASLPDQVRGEVIGGVLYTSPRPGRRHQSASRAACGDLFYSFDSGRGGPGGWIILAEPELHLGRETSAVDVVSPDLAGWRRERLPALADDEDQSAIGVVPDWVCEILSPSSVRHDRNRKAPRYLHHGVPWMWIIDPAARLVEAFEARDGRWTVVGVWTGDTADARIPPFDAVPLDLTAWWA